MKDNFDYFASAHDRVNDFANASGWDYSTFSNPYDYANGGDNSARSNANPAVSLPFSFSISNSTTDNVSSVVLLGANQNTGGVTNNGNDQAITITYQSGSVTYAQFLEGIKSNPFKVGKMHIQSATANQAFQSITMTQPQLNGVQTVIPLTPVLDPNQNQSGVTIINYPYSVDANTQLSFTVLAEATVVFLLYPQVELNVARGLDARPVSKDFSAPNLYQLPGM